MRAPDVTVGPYRERNTVIIRATAKDVSDPPVAIPGSQLTSCYQTLYSEHGEQAIINERNRVDIRALVNESGELTLTLSPDDMAIVDATARETEALTDRRVSQMEYHRLLLEWSWVQNGTGLPAEANTEIRVIVRDLHLVPLGSPA